jgi:hypothetical protein
MLVDMSYLLALIGNKYTTEADLDGTLEFHLKERPAFWSDIKHPRWAKGSRVVAKVVRLQVVALTGVLDCLAPEFDPLVHRDQKWDWRYDMQWDARPPRVVPVSDLGAPFDRPIRTSRAISREDFQRAYRALHGGDVPPQVDRDAD